MKREGDDLKGCVNCGCQYADSEAFCGICGNPLAEKPSVPEGERRYNRKRAKNRLTLKDLLLGAEIMAGLFLLMAFSMIPYEKQKGELNAMAEQTARVEVLEIKELRDSDGFNVYFNFPDGREAVFRLRDEYFDIISQGETGTLFYKERSGKESLDNRLFIRFEKDLY